MKKYTMQIWIGCSLLVWGVSTFDSKGIAFAFSLITTVLGGALLAWVNHKYSQSERR